MARRKISAEEKIRIMLEDLRGEEVIAELCRKESITRRSTAAGRRRSSKLARSGSLVTQCGMG